MSTAVWIFSWVISDKPLSIILHLVSPHFCPSTPRRKSAPQHLNGESPLISRRGSYKLWMVMVDWCYLTLVYLFLLSLCKQPTKSMLLSPTTDEESESWQHWCTRTGQSCTIFKGKDPVRNGPDLSLDNPGGLPMYLPPAVIGENLITG